MRMKITKVMTLLVWGFLLLAQGSAPGAEKPKATTKSAGRLTPTQALKIVTLPEQLPAGIAGKEYVNSDKNPPTIVAEGGSPPYEWREEGLSDTGLRLEPNNKKCKITGTPTESEDISFTLFVKDKTGGEVKETYTIRMAKASGERLQIDTDPLAATVNQEFETTLSAKGSKPEYRWEFDGPTPKGFVLTPGGRLSGKIATEGEHRVRVKVTDATGKLLDRQTLIIQVSREGEGWLALILRGSMILLLFGAALFAYWYLRSLVLDLDGRVENGQRHLIASNGDLQRLLTDIKQNTNTRLNELQGELRAISGAMNINKQEILAQVQQQSASQNAIVTLPVSYPEPEFLAKEPFITFPLTVESLMSKLKGSAAVVKPDFKNNILVNDPDGRGELALIRDDSVSGGSYFVIPRVPHFKTKQDFHIYYENYYDCSRPSSGEVLIIEPAEVMQVSGGWSLSRRGNLQVR
jgi:hypothetical protein